jgi:hypothetical protein
MSAKRGILTLAQGHQRYIDMAIRLAESIRLNSPGLPMAVVTDRPENEMKPWFDVVVEVNPQHGKGLIQKLFLYDYSPFEETIFIDADCLAVRDFSFLWDLFSDKEVSAIGECLTTGTWAGMLVEQTCANLNIPYIVQLNGGVYFFRKGNVAASVYQSAQALIERYDEIGIARLRGQINEEPLISLAMSMHAQTPVDDQGNGMRTPVGQSGVFEMDILKQFCAFQKHGIRVTPAIMHFGGGYPEAFHYRREVRKMDLHLKYKLPKPLASFLVNTGRNSVYGIYVLVYRIVKSLLGKARLKFRPALPMFKFE